MFRGQPGRIALATTLLILLAGSVAPVRAHADHSGEIAHIEQAHGGHDAVLITATDRQRPVLPDLGIPAGHVVLVSPDRETVSRGVEADPAKPRVRPPVRRPPIRAPPILL